MRGSGRLDPGSRLGVANDALGFCSLVGVRQVDPVSASIWNFIASVPAALVLLVLPRGNVMFSADGCVPAVLSGTVTFDLAHIRCYRGLAHIPAITAAVAQICVPLLAAFIGVVIFGRGKAAMTLRR